MVPTDDQEDEELLPTDPVDFTRGVSQAIFDAIRELYDQHQKLQQLTHDLAASFLVFEKGTASMYELMKENTSRLNRLEKEFLALEKRVIKHEKNNTR